MQQLTGPQLATNIASVAAGPAVTTNKGQDALNIFLLTSGGSASMTVNVEQLSPDGVSWHKIAQAVITTVGPQAVIPLWPYPGNAVRVNVITWSSGTLNAWAFLSSTSRD